MSTKKLNIPLLPLRDVVIFPSVVTPLFVGREKSITALQAAMAGDKQIMLVAQKTAQQSERIWRGSLNVILPKKHFTAQMLPTVNVNGEGDRALPLCFCCVRVLLLCTVSKSILCCVSIKECCCFALCCVSLCYVSIRLLLLCTVSIVCCVSIKALLLLCTVLCQHLRSSFQWSADSRLCWLNSALCKNEFWYQLNVVTFYKIYNSVHCAQFSALQHFYSTLLVEWTAAQCRRRQPMPMEWWQWDKAKAWNCMDWIFGYSLHLILSHCETVYFSNTNIRCEE